MGGMPSVSNRLRRAKVDEYIRLIMLRLLSINTILNTTLNNLLFLCYTSLFLIRVIYLSMIAKNCLSMVPRTAVVGLGSGFRQVNGVKFVQKFYDPIFVQ